MPAPQLCTVDHVVVNQRCRVHQLDRDRGSHQALILGARVTRSGRREHDQQGPQALASGEHRGGGVHRQRGARLASHPLEVLLGAHHPLTQHRPAAAHDLRYGLVVLRRLRLCGAAHCMNDEPSGGTVPAWMAMMPPAVSR